MTDDELDRSLRAWADATDPSTDPLRGADIRADADDGDVLADLRPARSRARSLVPWALVAAALLVVVAATAIRLDDDPPDDVTAGIGSAVPVQIILDAAPGESAASTFARIEVHDASGRMVVEGPVLSGTSLVVDQALAPGSASLRYEVYEANPTNRGMTESDGTPTGGDTSEPVAACDLTLDIDARPTRVVVGATGASGTTLECQAVASDAPPTLTIPPGWSLRDALPWTCGTTLDLGLARIGDVQGAWECFRDAVSTGRPAELPTSEAGPTDAVRRVWWRHVPDAEKPVEVIRAPFETSASDDGDWTIRRCTSAPGAASPSSEELDEVCDPAEALSLDLPALDAPPVSDPTRPDEQGQATSEIVPLRLVIEAQDPPVMIEGVLNRWVLAVDGSEVASGPVFFGAEGRRDARRANPSEITLAAEVEVDDGASIDLRWEMYACEASCPSVGPDGAPTSAGLEPFDECRSDPVQVTSDEPVVVVVLDAGGPGDPQHTCSARASHEVPELTVPPAWSLREPLEPLCGDDWAAFMADPLYEGAPSPSRDARLCLLRRFQDRARAEMTSAERLADGSTRRLVFRVQPTVVELVRPGVAELDVPWTRQVCTGLRELPESPWIEATGCGPEEEMPLTLP